MILDDLIERLTELKNRHGCGQCDIAIVTNNEDILEYEFFFIKKDVKFVSQPYCRIEIKI